ncbi:MAG: hypothetical protein H8E44_40570 [Planctomycetes bacterium]|nr:hypothetical protein [Planctomycetota bacterium]MBL7040653.1 hypothetical protein [Pirellulaceae bacterium]
MFADMSTLIEGIATHPGESFREILPYALVGAMVLVAMHLILALCTRREVVRKSRWNLWEKLVYLASIGSVAMLGATAFFGLLRHGILEGWLLFAHMFGAGAFVVVLPVLAITWCEASRFGGRRGGEEDEDAAPRFSWIPKVMFWIILVSGLTVTLTMLLSMLPLYGTDCLHDLLDVHRYAGLVAVVATVFHFYTVVLQRFGLR